MEPKKVTKLGPAMAKREMIKTKKMMQGAKYKEAVSESLAAETAEDLVAAEIKLWNMRNGKVERKPGPDGKGMSGKGSNLMDLLREKGLLPMPVETPGEVPSLSDDDDDDDGDEDSGSDGEPETEEQGSEPDTTASLLEDSGPSKAVDTVVQMPTRTRSGASGPSNVGAAGSRLGTSSKPDVCGRRPRSSTFRYDLNSHPEKDYEGPPPPGVSRQGAWVKTLGPRRGGSMQRSRRHITDLAAPDTPAEDGQNAE